MPQENFTKIREEFENSDISDYGLKAIADWWLTKFSHLLQERTQEIVKFIEDSKIDMTDPKNFSMALLRGEYRVDEFPDVLNGILDKVLALITSNKQL